MIRAGDGEISQLLCCRQKHDRSSPFLLQVMKMHPAARTFHDKAKSLPRSTLAAMAPLRRAKWFNFIRYEKADIHNQLRMDDLHIEGGGKAGIISRQGCAGGKIRLSNIVKTCDVLLDAPVPWARAQNGNLWRVIYKSPANLDGKRDDKTYVQVD